MSLDFIIAFMFKEFMLNIEMAVYKHRMKKRDAEVVDDFDYGRFKVLTPQSAIAEVSGHNADIHDRLLTEKGIYENVNVDGDSAYSGSGM